MRITKHIAFFYNEERFPYLNQMIQAANQYPFYTDIYIHCNQSFPIESLTKPTNGKIFLILHDITGKDPWGFPENTRNVMKSQKDDYDIFIYTEDDILIPPQAIQYWLDNKDAVLKEGFNLGFILIETDSIGEEFGVNLVNKDCISQQFYKICKINEKHYAINDVNTHIAFWIYDKQEFHRFVESKWWDPANIKGYDRLVNVAIGLHFVNDPDFQWYRDTLIPLTPELKLVNECKTYHLPNKYIKDRNSFFATVRFDEIVPLTQEQIINPMLVLQRKQLRLQNS
uniref:Glycosyltransferase 2-like domain-containing protein n=1 Tax=viral metagenome TaxID=1070528 RepID=A0A6C0KPN0_9ZZZZ